MYALFGVSHPDLLARDPCHAVLILETKGDFNVLEVPFLNKLQGPVYQLEIKRVRRVSRPLVRTLKIEPIMNLSQNCSHIINVSNPIRAGFRSSPDPLIRAICNFNANPIFTRKTGAKPPIGLVCGEFSLVSREISTHTLQGRVKPYPQYIGGIDHYTSTGIFAVILEGRMIASRSRSAGLGGGKSEHHRARCRVTPG